MVALPPFWFSVPSDRADRSTSSLVSYARGPAFFFHLPSYCFFFQIDARLCGRHAPPRSFARRPDGLFSLCFRALLLLFLLSFEHRYEDSRGRGLLGNRCPADLPPRTYPPGVRPHRHLRFFFFRIPWVQLLPVELPPPVYPCLSLLCFPRGRHGVLFNLLGRPYGSFGLQALFLSSLFAPSPRGFRQSLVASLALGTFLVLPTTSRLRCL